MNGNGHGQAVLFARFSPRPKKKKARNGRIVLEDWVTNEVQLDMMRQKCGEMGQAIRAEIAVPYASGGVEYEDDPHIQEAVSVLRRGDTLWVYNLERLARNDLRQALIFRDVGRKGCKVRSCLGEGTEIDGPMGALMVKFKGILNDHNRQTNAARTSAYMRHYQTQGLRMCGKGTKGIPRVPYGTMIDPDDDSRLIPHPEEQVALALMVKWRAIGHSASTIARMLTEQGHKPRGSQWWPKAITRILEREERT